LALPYEPKLAALRERIIALLGEEEGRETIRLAEAHVMEQLRRENAALEACYAQAERDAAAYNVQTGNLDYGDCQSCKNRGYIAFADGYAVRLRPCGCLAAREARKRLEESELWQFIRGKSLDNFDASEPHAKAMADAARGFLESGEGWLFIGGQVGSGKTHICTAVCGELVKAMQEVRYMLWRDEAAVLKGVLNTPEYGRRIAEYKAADVLYIDDFLKTRSGESPSAGDMNLATEILYARYAMRKRTILSSEWTAPQIFQMDEGVGSRIIELAGKYAVDIGRDERKNWRLKR